MIRLLGPVEKGLMLFNSYPFIFLFLPIVLLGYFALGRQGKLAPVIWLALASLAFYAFSGWQFVPLLLASIAFNATVGYLLIARKMRAELRLAALVVGISGDLLVLGIFKYAGFFAANFNALFSTAFALNILLPVGISFYSFTQIAFLVDAYRGNVARYALPHYALFVSYFPHLIAGPILHHKDMIPQFERAAARRPDPHLILCGLIIFAIGLFKKTCLADGIQPLVAQAFGPNAPTFDQAWIGVLAYTFQLYFDFSGYSDMAIGMSLMFGIFLPLNFNSPYKAVSIVDFWRRWHMTLSQFLRDYLYIPLGGNRHGRDLALRQPDDHDAARRLVARCGLDICHLGRAAWRVSLHQSRLEQLWPRGCAALCAPGKSCCVHFDVLVGRRRMGVFSRRQPVFRTLCAVEDGRSHAGRIRPR